MISKLPLLLLFPSLFPSAAILPQETALPGQVFEDWETLDELVELVRDEWDVPGIAVALVDGERTLEVVASGVRNVQTEDPLQPGDRFHIGSLTKSITALVVAQGVADDSLGWSDTVGARFDGLSETSPYAEVSIEALLWHRSGLPSATYFNAVQMRELEELTGTPTEQRGAWLRTLLTASEGDAAPESDTDPGYRYSNAGYALAAHLTELATGEPWERAVTARIFEPLGMRTAGFGAPAGPDAEHPLPAARGHRQGFFGLAVAPPTQSDLVDCLAPAGDVHASIEDLARYARFHLRGMIDDDSPQAALVRSVHVPCPHARTGEQDYAFGWVVTETPAGRPMHWHNGSTGLYFSFLSLLPEAGRAVVVLMNTAEGGSETVWSVQRSLAARHGW